jgi:hypothetical protein
MFTSNSLDPTVLAVPFLFDINTAFWRFVFLAFSAKFEGVHSISKHS